MGRPTHEAPTREYTQRHTQTQTNTKRGPTKYGVGSRRSAGALYDVVPRKVSEQRAYIDSHHRSNRRTCGLQPRPTLVVLKPKELHRRLVALQRRSGAQNNSAAPQPARPRGPPAALQRRAEADTQSAAWPRLI